VTCLRLNVVAKVQCTVSLSCFLQGEADAQLVGEELGYLSTTVYMTVYTTVYMVDWICVG